MGFLKEEELYRIAFDHKYSVAGCSFLDGLIMQRFWNWLVQFLPLKHNPNSSFHWTAPNTMTLLGLVLMVLPSTLMLWFSGDLVSPVPSWIYIFSGVALFVYQTLDALDGKQARRTGSSTPFGELFDHGCDSVSCVFLVMSIVCIRQLGVCWLSFGMVIGALLNFSGCHIQAYFVGCVTFGPIDVTELQLASVVVLFTAGLVDPNYFSSDVLVLGVVPAGAIPLVTILGGGSVALANNVVQTLLAPRKPQAPTSVLEMWGTAVALFLAAAAWFGKSKDDMTGGDGTLFFVSLGLFNSIKAMTVICAHMCKSALPTYAHLYNIPFILGAVNAYAGVVPETTAVAAVFCSSVVLFAHYTFGVCTEISSFLGITIFKVCAPTRKDTRPRLNGHSE